MDGLVWGAVSTALLVSLAALGLGLVLAARYRQLHERVMSADNDAGTPFPEPGTPAPAVDAMARDGRGVSSADLVNGRAVVVAFDTNCSACTEFLPEISAFLAERAERAAALALISGTETALGPYLSELPATVRVVAPAAAELVASFGVRAFPTILLYEDGVLIASGSRPGDVTPTAVAAGSA
jgi:hypothetical protein